ncbi:MAG: hypothetical protein ACUVTZ_07660 [Armatimonadota bacterium]
MAAGEFDNERDDEGLFYSSLNDEWPEAVQACVSAATRIVAAAIENGIAKTDEEIVRLYEKVFTKAVQLLEPE